mmetsp:Transcript_42811/g.118284  ORF Transcript_42811/g.118284 Transcript_42811/m.118284 type:complete len:225 (+) Transcript_42811:595-1269(+)
MWATAVGPSLPLKVPTQVEVSRSQTRIRASASHAVMPRLCLKPARLIVMRAPSWASKDSLTNNLAASQIQTIPFPLPVIARLFLKSASTVNHGPYFPVRKDSCISQDSRSHKMRVPSSAPVITCFDSVSIAEQRSGPSCSPASVPRHSRCVKSQIFAVQSVEQVKPIHLPILTRLYIESQEIQSLHSLKSGFIAFSIIFFASHAASAAASAASTTSARCFSNFS